jgi:hypothetical protein
MSAQLSAPHKNDKINIPRKVLLLAELFECFPNTTDGFVTICCLGSIIMMVGMDYSPL